MKTLTFDAYVKNHGTIGNDMPDDIFDDIMSCSFKKERYNARYKIFLKALDMYNDLADKENDTLEWKEKPCTECSPDNFLYFNYVYQFKCKNCGRGCI